MTQANFFGRRELGQLTEEERQKHYLNVCEAAGLDPNLNLLRWRMMDDGSGTGQKHLILYATKGATNAIRGVQGIDVVDMTENTIGGHLYVVTTKVKNAKGRTDIAKGAADLEGKRGKALENAVALAQTRSSRRATLQISGLDLLDESELEGEGTNPVSDAPTPLPPVKQPTAKVNSAAGADITVPAGLTLKTAAEIAAVIKKVDEENPELASWPLSEARLPNPAAGLKVATENLSGPGLKRAEKAVEVPPPSAQPVSVAPEEAATEAPKTKRAYKKRAPKAESESTPAEEQVVVSAVVEQPAPVVVSPVVKVASKGAKVPAERMQQYVNRLKDLRENVLPVGGLIPSHGKSPSEKLKLFFRAVNNNATDLMDLTEKQWDTTFEYIDGILTTQGPAALVQSINFNIGAVDENTAQ